MGIGSRAAPPPRAPVRASACSVVSCGLPDIRLDRNSLPGGPCAWAATATSTRRAAARATARMLSASGGEQWGRAKQEGLGAAGGHVKKEPVLPLQN